MSIKLINKQKETMNKKFSIKRVLYLLHRFFLENLSRELFYWCILTLVFIVLDQRDFVRWVLYIGGFLFSIRLFRELYRTPTGMNFLIIPATHTEKLTANIFLSTIYYFGMTLLTYALGNLIVTLVYHQILNVNIPVNWDLFQVTTTFFDRGFVEVIERNVFFEIFGTFALIQALGMLGSLYFKNNPAAKTIFSVMSFGFMLLLIQFILFKTLWDVKQLGNAMLSATIMISDSTIPPIFELVLTIGIYLLTPFLWVVSYFRLTEKQI